MKQDAAYLRVVLDTNVYLSAFVFPHGKVGTVWRLALQRRYIVVTSPFIVRELMRKLREKFVYGEAIREQIKRKVIKHAEVFQEKKIPTVIAEDPDDNHILACALAGKADCIVSGDKDLLRLKTFEGIAIVTPLEFLRILGES